MFAPDDTIVAIATPSGRGGLGVVRLSGPDAMRIACVLTQRARPLRPRHATLARFTDGAVSDAVVLTHFEAGASYTGDATVEVSAHGSPVVLAAIESAARRAGARLAAPGEFTLRAFLAGRIDLPQAEAVRDLIDATTPAQAQAAFVQLDGSLSLALRGFEQEVFALTAQLEASVDFPDEGYHFISPSEVRETLRRLQGMLRQWLDEAARGRVLREGARVVLVGRPNAGKSSLFNALLDAPRAIVADAPGTTRDLVVESMACRGVPVTLVDAAGLRASGDPVEREGVSRAVAAAAAADLVIVVRDGAEPQALEPLDVPDAELFLQRIENKRLNVFTKGDLVPGMARQARQRVGSDGHWVSVVTGEGVARLRDQIADRIGAPRMDAPPRVTNARQIGALEQAHAAMTRVLASLDTGAPVTEEFVLADLHDVRMALADLFGQRSPDDVLAEIFSRFCIGK